MASGIKLELIDELREMGITDERVLKAFLEVPREEFVPESLRTHAYENIALPIGYGQTISQPYTVAFMTQALGIEKGDKVLEIGTGSGYQAAILAAMGAQVFSVERSLELYNKTFKLLDKFNYKIIMKYGDGTLGWKEHAPYDKIIVTAGAPNIPETLVEQLKIGGRMVIPVGDKNSQKMVLLTKNEDGTEIKEFPNFRFVPLIGKEGWKDA
jgi:protein-L-isoaspartate(D-aspartate) O-methyltransferase